MKSERREDDCWREREEEESGGGDGTNKELKDRLRKCFEGGESIFFLEGGSPSPRCPRRRDVPRTMLRCEVEKVKISLFLIFSKTS